MNTKELIFRIVLNGNINPPLDPEKETTQVITANGDASLRDIDPEKDGNGYIVEAFIKDHGYTELTVKGDTLRLRHILKDGAVFDEAYYPQIQSLAPLLSIKKLVRKLCR